MSFYASLIYGTVYFSTYKAVKMEFQKYVPEPGPLLYAAASLVASTIGLAVYYPFILVKTRWITRNEHYNYTSVSQALDSLFK